MPRICPKTHSFYTDSLHWNVKMLNVFKIIWHLNEILFHCLYTIPVMFLQFGLRAHCRTCLYSCHDWHCMYKFLTRGPNTIYNMSLCQTPLNIKWQECNYTALQQPGPICNKRESWMLQVYAVFSRVQMYLGAICNAIFAICSSHFTRSIHLVNWFLRAQSGLMKWIVQLVQTLLDIICSS